MRQPILSPNGTPISRYAFGTMQFGGGADAAASQEMFEACISHGINHFDTAFAYTDGQAETLLGKFAAPYRDDLVIATKTALDGDASRDGILQSFETSCKRLDMEMVDILYIHRYCPDSPLEETYETLAELKSQGKIRHIGVSNHAAWQVMKSIAVAAQYDLTIDILQPMYNLVKRQAEVEIFPMAQDQGILLAPYSPLGGGLLSGKYSSGALATDHGRLRTDARYKGRYRQDWMWETAQQLTTLAQQNNMHPATLAVAWAAAHPAGPSPILSGRTLAQLTPSLEATSYHLSDDLYQTITALSPTPAPATDRLEETA